MLRPFVWGHFCLTYDGQKLLTDTDDIGIYGIKDGDKVSLSPSLCFLRCILTLMHMYFKIKWSQIVELVCMFLSVQVSCFGEDHRCRLIQYSYNKGN